MKFFLLALSVVVATPAMAAPQQFDLVCTGKYHQGPDGEWKPAEARYRVDLSRGAWCAEKCTRVRTIVAVEPGRLVLQSRNPEDRGMPYAQLDIDRTSGRYERMTSDGRGSFSEERGRCEPAPFSGFPTTKF